jgi:hypothetical protein
MTMPKNNSDPIRFAESVFGVSLWERQQTILRAVERDRRVAVKAAHSTGKTFAAACAALWFAARHRNARVIILAPGWLTVRAVIWSEIHSLLARARLKLPTTVENQTEIRFGPDNLIIGLSTNDANRLQGHHSEHLLIICDETPGISADFWPAIEGILASGDSHLLLLGNPVQASGYFYDAFGHNRESWTTFTISAFDTPNLAGLTLEALLKLPDEALNDNAAPYLTTRRWTAERHREWWNGNIENSPLWASRVLGEFPSAASNALIPLSALEAARWAPIDSGDHVIAGIDVAGPGKDRTTAVICCGGAILAAGIWTDSDARGPVLAFLRQWDARLRLVRVDSAGLGFYFAEHIRSAGYRTEGINVASAAQEKERFASLKAERYWRLRERFQRGEVSGLSDEMLAELAAIPWLIDPHGRIAIEGKVEIKSMLGRSPDLAEALMLAIGEAAPEPFNYIRIPFVSRADVFEGTAIRPETDRASFRARQPYVSRAEDAALARQQRSGRWRWNGF